MPKYTIVVSVPATVMIEVEADDAYQARERYAEGHAHVGRPQLSTDVLEGEAIEVWCDDQILLGRDLEQARSDWSGG